MVSCHRDCLQTCYVVKNDLELLIFWLPSPKCLSSMICHSSLAPPITMAISKTKERSGGNSDCLIRSPYCPLTGTVSSSQSMHYFRQVYKFSKVESRKTIRKKHTTKLPCNYSATQTLVSPKRKNEIAQERGDTWKIFPLGFVLILDLHMISALRLVHNFICPKENIEKVIKSGPVKSDFQ